MSSLAFAPSKLALLAFVACVPDAPERFVQHPPTLAGLRLRAPQDVIASYDVAFDRWIVATPGARAVIDAVPRAGIAGPDALGQAMKATVETRESLSDGFATTLLVHAASAQRVTVVVKQLGNQWVRCIGDVLLCKSLKRG